MKKVKILLGAGLTVGLFLLGLWGTANATPTELVSNGGFEDGFNGWNIAGELCVALNDGSFDPPGSGDPTAPYEGVSALIYQDNNPGYQVFWQQIDFSGSYTTASLSWAHQIDNYYGYYVDGQQEWSVELWGKSIYELFSTDDGQSSNQDWTTHTVDLSAFIGPQVYYLVFISYAREGELNVQLDNVSILATTTTAAAVPEPATIILFGCGLIGLAGVDRKKYLN